MERQLVSQWGKINLVVISYSLQILVADGLSKSQRQNLEVLEENRGGDLCDSSVRKDFNYTQKAKIIKRNWYLNYIKIKTYSQQKKHHRKLKKANHKLGKNICNIYCIKEKKITHFNSKKERQSPNTRICKSLEQAFPRRENMNGQ